MRVFGAAHAPLVPGFLRRRPSARILSFFGPPNPTRRWLASTDDLTFDLDGPTLNGVRLGAPLDRLSFLGPDEGRSGFRDGELRYRSRGLSVRFSLRTRTVVEYRIAHHDPLDAEFQSFRGQVVGNGRRLHLAAVSVESFVQDCGDCWWRDCDDDETILFYEFTGLEWQVEFSPAGRLRCITVTTDPIMHDEEQRLAYGVTAPWPPLR